MISVTGKPDRLDAGYCRAINISLVSIVSRLVSRHYVTAVSFYLLNERVITIRRVLLDLQRSTNNSFRPAGTLELLGYRATRCMKLSVCD